ncbi:MULTISPECIES: hypothetical protein [Parachlamydia]|jgi:hypothetical protein|uniref:hypothetical protein n=1 Tax=Parachlamydia TaxID=83551 RepID=UPI0009B5BE9A|nr:hypothetical protein [Parachlamydia acanthamoebae]
MTALDYSLVTPQYSLLIENYVRQRLGDFRVLCETIRVLIQYMTFESWEDLYRRIAVRYQLNIS